MLALDLGMLNRRSHRVGFREALAWSGVWISLAAAFAVLEFFWHGRAQSLQFVTGYVIELSLTSTTFSSSWLFSGISKFPMSISTKCCFGESSERS